MPTPFMHLALANRLRADAALPEDARQALTSDGAWGAFLLGSIAPDARLSSGTSRDNTHFYKYGPVIDPRPVKAMLHQYPGLHPERITDAQWRAFVVGYLAHLTMDEIWCIEMLFPHFVLSEMERKESMFHFHCLIGTLDRRDRAKLPDGDYPHLAGARPTNWLPFIADADLMSWRDSIASQLAPSGTSRTFDILGKVIGLSGEAMAAAVDDPERMARVWEQASPQQVQNIEGHMYDAVCQTVLDFYR